MDSDTQAVLNQRMADLRSEIAGMLAISEGRAKSADDALKAHIDSQKQANEVAFKNLEMLFSERDKMSAIMHESALLSVSKSEGAISLRLDGMNKFREQINAERLNYATRDTVDERLGSLNDKINVIEKLQIETKKTDWGLILGFISFGIVLIAGGWALIGLRTENAIGPVQVGIATLNQDVSILKTQTIDFASKINLLNSQSATSISERTELRNETAELKNRVSEEAVNSHSHIASNAAKLVEIETQFRASDEIRNVQFAEQLRWNGLFFEKTYPGQTYPTAHGYFPSINRTIHPEN